MKELLLVSVGSFFGGGARYLVSRLVQSWVVSFPLGTLTVNVLGCFIIGLLVGVSWNGTVAHSQAKLLLTTGFCGGFTTFSTFMNESATLLKDGHEWQMALYLAGSLVLGFLAVVLGQQLAKAISA